MTRQYEKAECIDSARLGQVLAVGETTIPAFCGDVDLVAVFVDPKTSNLVWVPYKSKVEIEEKNYTILRGKLRSDYGNRIVTNDQSIECMLDENENIHGMSDFFGKTAKVVYLNTSRWDRFCQYFFDRKNHKAEPFNSYNSIPYLKRHGFKFA